MKIVYEYSHLGGAEILQVRYPTIDREIADVVRQVHASRTKTSKEKTMPGKMLIAPIEMNGQFKGLFQSLGYREIRDRYTIALPNYPVTIAGAFKQVDYV